eukprot:2636628-Amphidinium_carterae.1
MLLNPHEKVSNIEKPDIENRPLIDDRDYYGNKRLELSGQLVQLLFEDRVAPTVHHHKAPPVALA